MFCRIYGKELIFHVLKQKLVLMLVYFYCTVALISDLIKLYVNFISISSIFFQGSTGVKFSDVAGIDEAVEELQEVLTQPILIACIVGW